MTGTSHAATGAALGLTFTAPIALPLALVSHFVVDSLPHFGVDETDPAKRKAKTRVQLILEGILISAILGWMMLVGAGIWVFAAIFLAILPDLIWLVPYVFSHEKFQAGLMDKFALHRFHWGIQKREAQKFWWVELLWFGLMLAVIINSINL